MNILTHDVINNNAMTVYPYPFTIPSSVTKALGIVLTRTKFMAQASCEPFKWVEAQFNLSLDTCAKRPALEAFVPQARADLTQHSNTSKPFVRRRRS